MNPITYEPTSERAILIQTYSSLQKDDIAAGDEFISLAKAAGAIPVTTVVHRRNNPDPKYYIGSGKANEIKSIIQAESLNLALFNQPLSPRQKRNLEKLLECRVIDRTELVLDIFSQRARSFEGKLQVSLAQLQHLSTRLVRGWTHLERQRGGIGLRGGPGETQLETDRRLIRGRIKILKAKLDKVKQQRYQNRQTRQRSRVPLVALVGYTNAGKSTLFNQLTHATTWVADQLFATLDPLLRQVRLPNDQNVILADTVGFIRDLPHELIDAFSATLEEVREADLLLHVVDASDPNHGEYTQAVDTVLEQIQAHTVPQLLVYNKIDRLSEDALPKSDDISSVPCIYISAKDSKGLESLYDALMDQLSESKLSKKTSTDT